MKRKRSAATFAESTSTPRAGNLREKIGGLRDSLDTLRQQADDVTRRLDLVSFFGVSDPALETNVVDFYAEMRRFEVFLITNALRRANGSQIRAARLLNLNHTTLNSKLKILKINHSEYSFVIEEARP